MENKILIFDDAPKNISLLNVILDRYYNKNDIIKISTKEKFLEAIDFYDAPDFVFINTDTHFIKEFKDQLIEYLWRTDTKVSWFYTDEKILKDTAQNIPTDNKIRSPFSIVKISSHVQDIDFFIHKEESNKNQDQYMKIDIAQIANKKYAPSNIFIKISDFKYLKIVNQHSTSLQEILDRFISKGLQEVYITVEDFHLHAYEYFDDELISEMLFQEQKSCATKNQDTIMVIFEDLGIDPEVIKHTLDSFVNIEKDINDKNDDLSGLLSNMKNNDKTFIYDHSYMTAVFCSAMAKKMESFDTTITEKAIQACLLHDLSITDPKVALLEHGNIKNNTKIDPKLKKQLLEHPKAIHKLAEAFGIDSDVLKVIESHHEGLGEASYPGLKPPQNLSSISLLFNVCHTITLELYKIGFNLSKKELAFKRVCEKLTHKKYENILATLNNVFLGS